MLDLLGAIKKIHKRIHKEQKNSNKCKRHG